MSSNTGLNESCKMESTPINFLNGLSSSYMVQEGKKFLLRNWQFSSYNVLPFCKVPYMNNNKKYTFSFCWYLTIPVFIWISFFKQMRWCGRREMTKVWLQNLKRVVKSERKKKLSLYRFVTFYIRFFWWNFFSLVLIFTLASCCCSSWLFHCPIKKNVFRYKSFSLPNIIYVEKFSSSWLAVLKTSSIVVVVVTFPACTL